MSIHCVPKEDLTDHSIKSLQAMLVREFHDHPPIASQHEGFALLQERMETLWDAIKRRERAEAVAEAFSVAAVAMRFVIEAPITHQSQE